MRSFGGEFVRGQKISLSGRSRQVETREEVLERTHQERERRKRQRLETKSATTIQAVWRSYRARKEAKRELRAEWEGRFGPHGDHAALSDISIQGSYLRQLCFFADAASIEDTRLLATACHAAVTLSTPPTGLPQLCWGVDSLEGGGAVAVLRAQRLVSLAIDALALHSAALAEELRAPRQKLTSTSAGGYAAALAEAAMVFGAADVWKGALGAHAAQEAVAQVLAPMLRACPGLFEKLAVIAAAGRGSLVSPMTNGAVRSVPLAETLCTNLIVRYISAQGRIEERLHGGSASQAASLLCVPGLQRSCPSLTPILGRLWRTAVSGLHTLPPPALAQWLPSTLGSGGKAGAGAALLGNLLEAAPSGLTPDPRHGEAALQRHSMHFMHVSASLLNLVPPGALFGPGTQWQAEDGADENGALEAEGASTATEQLPWDGTAPPMEVSDQLRLLADPGFIEAVTRAALPVASASPSQPVPDLTTAAAAAARQTCTYLSTILRLPGERQRILLALAFRAGLVQRLWFCFLRPAFEARGTGLWEQFGDDSCDPGWLLPLCLFSEVFSTSLMVSGDKGLYTRQEPLPLEELYSPERPVGVLSTLRSTLWNVLWLEAVPSTGWPRRAVSLRTRFARSAGRLMGQLHDRNGRRPFAPPEVFYAEGIVPERFRSEVASGVATGRGAEESDGSRAWAVLSSAPYLVPFLERARIFQRLVSAERSQYHDGSSLASALFDNGATRQFVAVQRGRVLDDAFAALGNSPSEDLRGRVRVAFTNEFGAAEAGIDGGGLFKEFLEAVVKEGFDPGRGLFRATTDNRLYPNPHAVRAVPDALRLLEFLGRMVGKALWEGILLELPLASFFLKKFRGAAADVDDLPTLDPVLARSLMSLEDYPGDVADLGLTFSLTDDVLGKPEEVDLVPGGRNLPVTSANARLFIHRVAEFKLNVQLREPVAAFLKGFRAMVPGTWVEMFNDMELQELIGGAEGGAALDLRDMQAHVAYSAGYSAEHPVIVAFWEALSGMTPQEQADFLRFVTSCPRPPLLGFGYLEPPLCIQMAGPGEEGGGGTERLPTAATCMNLLKLPPYRGGTAQVREKLLYAIQAGAGFDLS